MEKREKRKKKPIQDLKKKLYITIKPENYEFVKNNGPSVSQFVDNALDRLRNKTNKELVFILQNNGFNGLVAIRTRDLRRVKATS